MPKLRELLKKSINGKVLSFKEANWLINRSDEETFELIFAANEIKNHYKGNKVKLCSIVNAKSGKCSENCMFCAQSAHHRTKVDIYPLISSREMFKSAESAYKTGATCFGIVTSGKSIKTDKEIDEICRGIRAIKANKDIKGDGCASLGILTKEQLKKLKDAGLEKFHHNLETAKSFFGNMCSTHSFEDRIKTVKTAKGVGLSVCCGGIFGLGESLKQRIELGFQIKELDPDSIPINILNPVKGTKAQDLPMMPALEALRLVAVYRFIMPDKDIGIFGGRELSLGSLQPLMFIAGANMTLLGNYLTTKGNKPEDDLKMISDLGLEVEKIQK
jgi:biotin synthase